MLTKNYMTPNPATITPKEDVETAFHILKMLMGIVTDADSRAALTKLDLTVGNLMTSNPVTILEDATVEEAARIISDRKLNSLPVVSKTGELIGIITVTDILNNFLIP